MAKEIPLSNGKVTMVDDEDYEKFGSMKWHQHYRCGYVQGSVKQLDGRFKMKYLHRLIMDTPDGMSTDHISMDKLDNRKCNLRIATQSQNLGNQNPRIINGIKREFKGVFTAGSRYRAKIRNKWLGTFETKIEAAIAYDKAAIKYFGEFALTNFPRNNYVTE